MKTLCFNFIAASILLFPPASLYAWQQDEGTQNEASGNTPDLPKNPAPEISALSGIGGADGFGGSKVVGDGSVADDRWLKTDGVMFTWSEKNDELRGFSIKLGDWEVINIEPQDPTIRFTGDTVAAVRFGDSIAAFSGEKGWWDVIELSKGSKAMPVVYASYVQIEDDGHLYTFASEKGAWTSPTDPELQQATETMNLRFENPGKASHFSLVEPRMKAFEKWRDSQPKYKARGIQLTIQSSNGKGIATLETARQSWMTELKAKMHEVFDVSDSAGENIDATTEGRLVSDLEARINVLQVELNALRSAKPESSDAATKQPDRAPLRRQIEQAFDVRQQLQELEAQKLRLKLQLIESNLDARKKNRDGIIERRVEELLTTDNESTKKQEQTTAPQPVEMLMFTASYCGPCQKMMPIVQSMIDEGLPVRILDITTEPHLTRRNKVDRIPTFLVTVDGKEKRRIVGVSTEAELRRSLRFDAAQLRTDDSTAIGKDSKDSLPPLDTSFTDMDRPLAESANGKQPIEIAKVLRGCRDEMAVRIQDLEQQQNEIDKYSKSVAALVAEGVLSEDGDAGEFDRTVLLNTATQDLKHYDNLRKNTDRDWHQAWSEYQSQLRLLQLGFEAAEATVVPANHKHEIVKARSKMGRGTSLEVQQAESELKLAEIQLRRASELLQLYTDIEKNEPQLNPDYKAPAVDEATGIETE